MICLEFFSMIFVPAAELSSGCMTGYYLSRPHCGKFRVTRRTIRARQEHGACIWSRKGFANTSNIRQSAPVRAMEPVSYAVVRMDNEMTLLKAIAMEEGFFVAGSRARRNNNPGNLDYGPFAIAHGATRIEEIPPDIHEPARFAYFPTPDVGFAALQALLESSEYAGLTVEAALAKYAPASENDTSAYVHNVCGWVGCSPDAIISSVMEAA